MYVYIYIRHIVHPACLFTFCQPLRDEFLILLPKRQVSMQSQSCGVVGGTPGPSGSTHSAKMNLTPEGSVDSKSSLNSPASEAWPANLEYPKFPTSMAGRKKDNGWA